MLFGGYAPKVAFIGCPRSLAQLGRIKQLQNIGVISLESLKKMVTQDS